MMAGSKFIGALVVGLLAVTGTAFGAGWGSHATTATTLRPAGMIQSSLTRHEFRGRITYVSRSNWFKMRTKQGRLIRIGVNNATHWNRCNWDAMRAGRHVDVHAVHHNRAWMATRVSPWTGNWNDHWGDMSDHMDDHMGDGYGHMG